MRARGQKPLPPNVRPCPSCSALGCCRGAGLQEPCVLRGGVGGGGLCSCAPPGEVTREPVCLHLSPEVGVCSFARFSGELLQPGPGASEAAPVQAAADGPETPVQDPGQTLCFSALGLAQCCKVGVEARVQGSPHRWREEVGRSTGGSGQFGECAKDVRSDTGV